MVIAAGNLYQWYPSRGAEPPVYGYLLPHRDPLNSSWHLLSPAKQTQRDRVLSKLQQSSSHFWQLQTPTGRQTTHHSSLIPNSKLQLCHLPGWHVLCSQRWRLHVVSLLRSVYSRTQTQAIFSTEETASSTLPSTKGMLEVFLMLGDCYVIKPVWQDFLALSTSGRWIQVSEHCAHHSVGWIPNVSQ